MEPAMMFGNDWFSGHQPWDVVFDAFNISHSEFWVVADEGFGVDVETAIPDGDTLGSNGQAVGIPTKEQRTRVAVALSAWADPPPSSSGTFLGERRLHVPERELTCMNVEGREPGPALVLPDPGEYHVKVWRNSPSSPDDPERYDLRVWPCSGQ